MRLLVIINDQAGQGLSDLASLFEISDFFDSALGVAPRFPDVGTGEPHRKSLAGSNKLSAFDCLFVVNEFSAFYFCSIDSQLGLQQ
jgi:hypothetical protein